MDKSMTGDGAVVRDAAEAKRLGQFIHDALSMHMCFDEGWFATRCFEVGDHLANENEIAIRQQAAEIERLTRDNEAYRLTMEAIEATEDTTAKRAEASEARNADLLKALERYGQHPKSCASGWAFQPCDCGLSEAISGLAGAPLNTHKRP